MDNFKEFQAKDLDKCISAACSYFNAPRENLEIEIIQDAKSGIFGIVLARKAKIRARRARLQESARDILGMRETPKKTPPRQAEGSQARGGRQERGERTESFAQDRRESREKPFRKPSAAGRPVREPEPAEEGEFDAEAEGLPVRPIEELDRAELEAKALEIVEKLLRPLADREFKTDLAIERGSVHASVQWEGDAGLLIGREGQTLAALQYLASRMLSHSFNAALRVQLDIGDYRRKQDEKLRGLAVSLAEKARQTGRSWSTRPLSSYHRRVIHMCLQDAHDVQTRSSGDGPLKRVVISPRRHSEKY